MAIIRERNRSCLLQCRQNLPRDLNKVIATHQQIPLSSLPKLYTIGPKDMEAKEDYAFVVFFIISANLYVCQISADTRS